MQSEYISEIALCDGSVIYPHRGRYRVSDNQLSEQFLCIDGKWRGLRAVEEYVKLNQCNPIDFETVQSALSAFTEYMEKRVR